MVQVDRLREEVLGPELHRAHGRLDVTLPREQDDGAAARAQPFQHVEPARIRQVEVEDHYLGPHPLELVEARLAGLRAGDLEAEPVEVVAQRLAQVGVVVDQQDAVSHRGTSARVSSPDPPGR